jgi:tetratricopeptide (TPR) repeat protein
MDWNCLLVDLTGSDLAETWQEKTSALDLPVKVSFAGNVDEAQILLNNGGILNLVIFSDQNSGDVQLLLKSFQSNVGCIADFQAIVCSDPSAAYMAGVFEFGVEQFFALETWAEEMAAMIRKTTATLADPSSAESRTVALSRSIRSADQAAIQRAAKDINDLAEYDYRAAYAKGKACEATGDYDGAANSYKQSSSMNKMFRPGKSSLGETLLVTGRIDEALELFRNLEKTNPYDVERKANIAAAYIEKGDFESANRYVEIAEKIAPNNSRVLEAKAQVLLCTGKVGEAFKLMDGMSEVGPFFAAKLNELGIQLSQSGKGKSALALYQKAHKIVRPELKYKISMNAALACRRLQAWDMALKYLARCEKEFGSSFPKLQKIKESIMQVKAQSARKTGGSIDEAG